MMLRIALWLIDLAVTVLPESLVYRAARALAPLAMPLAERRRQTVRNNIQRLQPSWEPPELDRATRGVFQETAMYYVDTALLPRHEPQQLLRDRLQVEGLETLQEAVDGGRGVILVGAHLSNPEVAFQALVALEIDAIALVEPLADPRIMSAMRRRRERWGLPFVGVSMEGVKQAITHLQKGGVVAILTDRDLQGHGVCVPFMSRLARFPTGAVDLALRTDAALVLGWPVREHDLRFRVHFEAADPLLRSDNRANDVRANLANVMRQLESPIAAHCQQWRMFESPWAPCRDTTYHEGGAARPLSGTPR
ncbi:MAG: hypothetical protein O6913_02525 [Chloroflexi bacterium]|nr:hypothetical protein [Chloroflexota bacterium]